jgi:hypothetical protein
MATTADVREARDHPALEWPARLGMVAYGVVYLLVGWLAAHLALGNGGGKPSGSGALHELAQQPLGSVLLWLVAIGLLALATWEVCQAIAGHRSDDGMKRLGARAASGARAVVMGTLAVLAVKTVFGDSGGGGRNGWTEKLMSMPFGPALVVALGLVVVGVGLLSAYRGLSDRWRKGLEVEGQTGDVGTVVALLARVGYLSRAVAFLVIGALFVWAGWTHHPERSGGLDQAIMRFRDEPFGPPLMVLVAVGLGCYGAFHLFRGWYLRGG